jgi:hypothetical protein
MTVTSTKECNHYEYLRHFEHIALRVSHANCRQCNADNQRRFAHVTPFRYGFVHEYLSWIRPRLAAIRDGENSVDARRWHRDFMQALHTRISSRGQNPAWRKLAPGYLERLQMTRFPRSKADADYVREFARTGASCL